YQVGLRAGIDAISHYARMFGLGVQTGIGLLNEKDGIVPSSSWKKLTLGEEWYEGETLSVAIGQGYTSITPIQLLILVSAIANGGKVYIPFAVSEVISREGILIKKFFPTVARELNIDPSTLEIIKSAMYGVVNEPNGTGYLARLPDVEVGGKTGTAQVVSYDSKRTSARKLNDHAWFVSFAPVKDPEIAVVVLVEHGGHGATAAAPVAKKVLSAYFEKKKRLQDERSKGTKEL
ncbi:MAG: penicillin-binding transpeptidase domain-containing protein, partial [Candidatus Aenigmatarchaeota archaeon]